MRVITFISLFIKRQNRLTNNIIDIYDEDDEFYNPDYSYILGVRNKRCTQLCHIDIDKHGVNQESMNSLGSNIKENKKLKIYKKVRKKYSYMNYPFYSNKI